MPGTCLQERRVGVLPEREDERVGLERLELAGGLREALVVERHHFDREGRAVDLLDRAQPVDLDAFLDRFVGLEVVGGHLLARAAVDDERIGAEPPRGARRVHRRVAAAVDRDAPANLRCAADLDALEELQRVVDLAGVARRDVLALAEVRADGQKDRVEPAVGLFGHEILDFVVEDDLDAEVADAIDLGVEHFARQAVFRDAEVHHAARHRSRFVDDHRVAQEGQVPGRRQAARSGADDEHALARRGTRGSDGPSLLERHVAEEPLDRVDADRLIDVLAVARVLARVIAHAAVHRRHRIVADDDVPGLAIAAGLRLGEPGLDVFAGRAGVVARRQAIDVERPHRADRRPMTSGSRASIFATRLLPSCPEEAVRAQYASGTAWHSSNPRATPAPCRWASGTGTENVPKCAGFGRRRSSVSVDVEEKSKPLPDFRQKTYRSFNMVVHSVPAVSNDTPTAMAKRCLI